MKFLSLTLLTVLCCAFLGCGESQGAKHFATAPTPPAIPSEPADDGNTDESQEENPQDEPQPPEIEDPPTDSEAVQPPETEEPPDLPEQDETNDDAQTTPDETPETETPEQTILTATEDTMEIAANTTLVYRFQANRAGILSILSEYTDCIITVKKLSANEDGTPVDTPEEYAVQAGDVFLITVSNSSNKSLEWCIFLDP